MKIALQLSLFVLITALLSSCVGNKKIAYLQKKDAKGETKFFSDTTLASDRTSYKFQTGDVLYVKMEKFKVGEDVFSISNFQMGNYMNQIVHPYIQGYRIDTAGFITIPLLGEIFTKNRTLYELKTEIEGLVEKQYPGAVVEIYQMDATVTVLGEVNHAGRFPLYKDQNNLFDAIVMAGDLTDYADRAHIKIVRGSGSQQEVFHVDLTDVNSLASQGFFIQNNDVVIVTPLKRNKYTTANIQWLISSVTALVAVASLVLSISR